MKAGNDDGATIFSFVGEGDAAGELIRSRAILEISREIDVGVEKPGVDFRFGVLGDVRIADEVRPVIGTTGDLHRVPDWILTTELLNQTEEHVSHKSLGG